MITPPFSLTQLGWRPHFSQQLTLEDVTQYLLDEGLSKHFLPERLELVEQLPKTQSGKIRKFEIRNRLARSAEQRLGEHVQSR
jgi:non-ribosomal peptide synthetase component E (peptide arylation enzyme)